MLQLQRIKITEKLNNYGNTSGLGAQSIVPDEIKKWNWGACLLSVIWALSNRVWEGLWGLVPIANIFMFFRLGAKGNELAWKSKEWHSLDEFKHVQKIWTRVAFALLGFSVFMFLITIPLVLFLFKGLFNQQVTETINILESNTAITEIIGSPIESHGMISGSSSSTGATGQADINFKVKGNKASGLVQSIMRKDIEGWEVIDGKFLSENGTVINIP